MADDIQTLLDGLSDAVGQVAESADEHQNVVLAAGAVTGALLASGRCHAEPVVGPNGQVTGEVLVGFEFLKSQYKITLERVK